MQCTASTNETVTHQLSLSNYISNCILKFYKTLPLPPVHLKTPGNPNNNQCDDRKGW